MTHTQAITYSTLVYPHPHKDVTSTGRRPLADEMMTERMTICGYRLWNNNL